MVRIITLGALHPRLEKHQEELCKDDCWDVPGVEALLASVLLAVVSLALVLLESSVSLVQSCWRWWRWPLEGRVSTSTGALPAAALLVLALSSSLLEERPEVWPIKLVWKHPHVNWLWLKDETVCATEACEAVCVGARTAAWTITSAAKLDRFTLQRGNFLHNAPRSL